MRYSWWSLPRCFEAADFRLRTVHVVLGVKDVEIVKSRPHRRFWAARLDGVPVGRDPADTALTTTFGVNRLESFNVWTHQVRVER